MIPESTYSVAGDPLVTIGIPTFNQPEYLRRAIQSVLSQTFSSFELIIVDDCSSHTTRQTVRLFDDKRVHYIRLRENVRPPRSWNVAARAAKGRYFAILPHDDFWEPNFLGVMVNEFLKNESVGFVQCNFNRVDKDEYKIDSPRDQIKVRRTLFGVEAVRWQLERLWCNPAAVLLDVKHLRAAGYWSEHYWDDWAILIKLAFRFGFATVPSVLSNVRSHDANLSTILGREGRLPALFVVDQLFDIFSWISPHDSATLKLFDEQFRKLSISIFFTAVKSVFFKRNLSQALEAFRMSRALNARIPFDHKILSTALCRLKERRFL